MQFHKIQLDDNVSSASPYAIHVDNVFLTYTDEDAFPYVVTDKRVLFGPYGTEHDDIHKKYNTGKHGEKTLLEGRYWWKSSALVNWIWKDVSVNQDAMRILANSMKKRLGLNPANITYFLECIVPKTEEHELEKFIVELPLSEYLSLGVTGNESEFFWHIMHKNEQQTVKVKPTANGMDSRDVWRHYEMVGESIKLTRNDLRKIVSETINRLFS